MQGKAMCRSGDEISKGGQMSHDLTKTQAETAHAKRRAAERLGINLNKKARRTLIHAIQHGELHFVRRQSLRKSIFRCIINEQPVDLVYDRQRKRIITFLYPEEEITNENKTNDTTQGGANDSIISAPTETQPTLDNPSA